VILSYSLLFNQHRNSQGTFDKIRNKLPSFARHSDANPCLVKLCSSDCSAPLYEEIGASTPAEQYSARKEFPLLGQRLVKFGTLSLIKLLVTGTGFVMIDETYVRDPWIHPVTGANGLCSAVLHLLGCGICRRSFYYSQYDIGGP